jgi:hypothetical protein
MMTEPEPVERVDRYTILVDGYRVRATPEQERQLREMDSAARARFLRVMGHTTPDP